MWLVVFSQQKPAVFEVRLTGWLSGKIPGKYRENTERTDCCTCLPSVHNAQRVRLCMYVHERDSAKLVDPNVDCADVCWYTIIVLAIIEKAEEKKKRGWFVSLLAV